MKTKWILGILAVPMICLIFSAGQGGEEFYYGGLHVDDLYDKCSELGDSLRFNMVSGFLLKDSIQHLAGSHLRAIGQQVHDEDSPTSWSRKSHYTLWEAEGFPGSNKNLEYDGGNLVDDDSASGDKAMKFSGPGTAQVIQTGPTYYQEPEYRPGVSVDYTAEFCLKFVLDTTLAPATKVCSLMVVDAARDSVLKDTTVCRSDFGEEGLYRVFEVGNYTVPSGNQMEFQVYWFGEAGDFYIDYVKVYDANGELLMSGQRDQNIIDYVSADWAETENADGHIIIYRWGLRDEPPSIDLYMPTAHIDTLLKQVSEERVGIQAFNRIADPDQTHEYLLRQNPVQLCVDIYPMDRFGNLTTGSDYQEEWTEHTEILNAAKSKADSLTKEFWLIAQAHTHADTFKGGDCPYPLIQWGDTLWCPNWREPSQYELRLQTFLGLCYGADAIVYFHLPWEKNGDGRLSTGLYDTGNNDSTTYKWREIKEFTGPRVDKVAPILKQLSWQGAGFHEDVAIITGSFMDSLKAAPAETLSTTYVEVGFFEDNADTDYFMLVNRQCLENEDQSVIAYLDSAILDKGKMWYVIDQYSQDTTFTGAMNGSIPFTTHLDPGEGKLFKLVRFPDSAFHGTAYPLKWQGGILVDGDVTVDSGQILNILLPAEITFYANTDVVKTWDTTDCDLVINGGMRAVGAEEGNIVFTSTGSGEEDDWTGIVVNYFASDGVHMEHCRIENAYIGIDLRDSNPDTVANSHFYNSLLHGVSTVNSQGVIKDNYIRGKGFEGQGAGIYMRNVKTVSPVVTGNTVDYCQYGLQAKCCSTATENNRIGNVNTGILSDSCDYFAISSTQVVDTVSLYCVCM
jgi:hypothetical protein